jgi:uncharacterized protein YaaN involved in tellurite resistance
MRSEVAKRILKETPEEIQVFTRHYARIMVQIHRIIEAIEHLFL